MSIKKHLLVSLFVSILWAGNTLASGMATFKGDNTEDGTINLEYLNNKTMRMNINQKEAKDSYILVRDGKAYMVAISKGETMVMDMAKLGSMAQSMGADMAQDAFKQELLDYKKTGRSETVAGYKGTVYSITWRDTEGAHTEEAVFSSHRDVLEYTEAWMGFAKTMASSMGQSVQDEKSIQNFLSREGKGVLRMGKDFRVVSIEPGNISAGRFELPAAPMQMPGFSGFGGSPSQNTAGFNKKTNSDEQQSGWGALFGQKAERHTDRQKQRVESQTDRQVDRTVDKAVDGLFRGIFGR